MNTIISEKKFNKLITRLSRKDDYRDIYDLEFNLYNNLFVSKWLNRFLEANQRQDSISEPWALYSINNTWTAEYTLNFLNEQINLCNNIHPGMFDRNIGNIKDQDTLNYLHSVFELHHGQLDTWQDNNIFHNDRGDELRHSLSHINQTVHRCEGHNRNPKIRVVYFDLPKTETFTEEDYSLFTNEVEFGGVYTLYADVGKNLESLASDNDDHHHDFVPNLHYSADFVIRFYGADGVEKQKSYDTFYQDNKDYFNGKGYAEKDPRLTTGSIKIAQLVYTDKHEVLDAISNYDNIQSVFII